MSANNYNNMNDGNTFVFAKNLSTVLASDPASYGVTLATATSLTGSVGTYQNSLTDLEQGKAALKAKTSTKNSSKAAVIAKIQAIAKDVYANEAVTPAMLGALGLAVHGGGGAPISPTAPNSLWADAFSNGTVKLKWNRGTNPQGVTFVIEAWNGTAWNVVWVTTKAKATLNGFAPGVEVRFRMYASHNSTASAYSNEAIIYGSGDSQFLQLAA
ncbi:MAG: fibronectin type III domain-containing protein [Fimbriimonadaceae bacterium]